MKYDQSTALVIVDMQNDFVDPKGSLYVSGAEKLAPFINTQIEQAQHAGAFVVFTQDWHPPSTPHFQKDGGIWPVHCVRETWGAEFHPSVHHTSDSQVVRKGTQGQDGYSGFSFRDPVTGRVDGTGLEQLLQAHGVNKVAILGVATDYCVKETALDAATKGFHPTLLTAGISAVELAKGDGARALEDMRGAGVQLE